MGEHDALDGVGDVVQAVEASSSCSMMSFQTST